MMLNTLSPFDPLQAMQRFDLSGSTPCENTLALFTELLAQRFTLPDSKTLVLNQLPLFCTQLDAFLAKLPHDKHQTHLLGWIFMFEKFCTQAPHITSQPTLFLHQLQVFPRPLPGLPRLFIRFGTHPDSQPTGSNQANHSTVTLDFNLSQNSFFVDLFHARSAKNRWQISQHFLFPKIFDAQQDPNTLGGFIFDKSYKQVKRLALSEMKTLFKSFSITLLDDKNAKQPIDPTLQTPFVFNFKAYPYPLNELVNQQKQKVIRLTDSNVYQQRLSLGWPILPFEIHIQSQQLADAFKFTDWLNLPQGQKALAITFENGSLMANNGPHLHQQFLKLGAPQLPVVLKNFYFNQTAAPMTAPLLSFYQHQLLHELVEQRTAQHSDTQTKPTFKL